MRTIRRKPLTTHYSRLNTKMSKSKVSKTIISIMDGSFLNTENVVKNLPFMLFVMGLGIMYIANSYYSEKTILSISRTGNDLKELRSEYITGKSELMTKSKQSEVAKLAAQNGLKESVEPPKKIIITE